MTKSIPGNVNQPLLERSIEAVKRFNEANDGVKRLDWKEHEDSTHELVLCGLARICKEKDLPPNEIKQEDLFKATNQIIVEYNSAESKEVHPVRSSLLFSRSPRTLKRIFDHVLNHIPNEYRQDHNLFLKAVEERKINLDHELQ
jgi:hypothetical protein